MVMCVLCEHQAQKVLCLKQLWAAVRAEDKTPTRVREGADKARKNKSLSTSEVPIETFLSMAWLWAPWHPGSSQSYLREHFKN